MNSFPHHVQFMVQLAFCIRAAILAKWNAPTP